VKGNTLACEDFPVVGILNLIRDEATVMRPLATSTVATVLVRPQV